VTLVCFVVSVAVVVYVPTQVPLTTTIEGGVRHFRGGAPLPALLIPPYVLWRLWRSDGRSDLARKYSRRDVVLTVLLVFPFVIVFAAGQVYLGVAFLRAGGALG
jgi:hypothetical protein